MKSRDKYNSITQEEIKTQIIKDRLTHIFTKKPKAIAKILTHLIKRSKSV
jgi:hypothetical protein